MILAGALVARLLPRRSIAGTARPPKAATVLAALRTDWSRAPLRGKSHAELFEAGLRTNAESTSGPPRRAAFEWWSEPKVERLAELDVETLAVAERMAWHMGTNSLASLIAETTSVANAVRSANRAVQLTVKSDRGFNEAVRVEEAPRDNPYYTVHPHWLLPLRHVVAAAPPDAYAEARVVANDLRAAARVVANDLRAAASLDGWDKEGWERALLAYTFPDEPWASEDLLEGLGGVGAHGFLVSASADVDALARFVDSPGFSALADYAFDVAAALAPDDAVRVLSLLLPKLLVRSKHGTLYKTPPRQVAAALGFIATPEAAAALAPYAAHAIVGPQVVEFFRAHPELAPADAKGRAGAVVARVVEKRAKRANEDAAARADADAVPPILRERPWRKKSSKKKVAPIALSIRGLELAYVDVEILPPPRRLPDDVEPMTEAEVEDWQARAHDESTTKRAFLKVDREFRDHRRFGGPPYRNVLVPPELGLAAWNEGRGYTSSDADWVRAHGLASVPGFAKRDWVKALPFDPELHTFTAVRALVDPRIAPSIARAASRKRVRRVALAWLAQHAEVAVYGLLPDAVGSAGEAQTHAIDALLDLARSGKRDVIEAVAKAHGAEAHAAIVEILARDPLALGAAAPKRPSFLYVDELSPIRLADGRLLEDEARDALLEMLQVAPLQPPYEGFAQVRAACDEGSLGALALELVEQWALGDAPGRHDWMLHAAAHLPCDVATRRVAALAREWARNNGAKSDRACGALAAIGSDLALTHLGHVAETSRFDALRKAAAELISEAAESRGLSEDELGDRTVPDCGLDASGTITILLGDRELIVSVNESSKLVVRERGSEGALGAPATSLPRATKDEPAAAREVRARFKALAHDVGAVAERQVRRLERAMVEQRTWSKEAFEAFVVRHPLLCGIARGIVWKIAGGVTFRVAEDGTYADPSDRPVALDSDAKVRIAHPARTRQLAKLWADIFAEYGIVQPFEQLGRVVEHDDGGVPGAASFAYAEGHVAPARKVMGVLESRGFRRNDNGHVSAYRRAVRSNTGRPLVVEWRILPGFTIEGLASAPDQTTQALTLRDESGAKVGFESMTEVGRFELARDVEAILRR